MGWIIAAFVGGFIIGGLTCGAICYAIGFARAFAALTKLGTDALRAAAAMKNQTVESQLKGKIC